VQDRDAGGLALVEKTDALDVHEIYLLQIQRHSGFPSLELGLELAKMLGSKLATQPDSGLSAPRNPFDPERHDRWPMAREAPLQESGHSQLIAVTRLRCQASHEISGIPPEIGGDETANGLQGQ